MAGPLRLDAARLESVLAMAAVGSRAGSVGQGGSHDAAHRPARPHPRRDGGRREPPARCAPPRGLRRRAPGRAPPPGDRRAAHPRRGRRAPTHGAAAPRRVPPVREGRGRPRRAPAGGAAGRLPSARGPRGAARPRARRLRGRARASARLSALLGREPSGPPTSPGRRQAVSRFRGYPSRARARPAVRIDPIEWIGSRLPVVARCRVPRDLEAVTARGAEIPARDVGISPVGIVRIWRAAERLYRTGGHPALQLCTRHRGATVLQRAIGHAAGNAPGEPEELPKVLATPATPFNIFSAAKAVTAMVIHKLDEKGMLRLEDRVSDYIPAFGRHGKHRITLHHILAHRAGIPNLPPEAIDLNLLGHPDRVVEILCDARPRTRPGRLLAYHAVSGGFVLAEVVRQVCGQGIQRVLEKEILEPLRLRWMRYGVAREDLPRVAVNALTGPLVPPPLAQILRGALGTSLSHAVELSNDPRFLLGTIPSANVVTTADELAAFFQCLLQEGELDGVRVFDPRTVHRATSEQSWWEMDWTLALPIRYGLGFMLGGKVSLFGADNPAAFGHLGLSNVIGWADPDRELAVALLNSGKPVVSPHVLPLAQLLLAIGHAFPRQRRTAER